MSTIDAYAAGLLDGEGTISIRVDHRPSGDVHVLQINVGMTDLRPLNFMAENFGGGIHGPVRRGNPRHKPLYQWQVSARVAEAFLRRVRPYLVLKGEQADVALALRAISGRQGIRPSDAIMSERRSLKEQLRVLNQRGVAA